MNCANKQDARTLRRCFAAITISVGMLLAGCDDSYLPVTAQSWSVRDCEVHETIQQSKNNWPDACCLRTYRLTRDGRTLAVGSYENESAAGVTQKPYSVDGYVLIPTSCYVYRIGPDNRVDEFYPWKADKFLSFSESHGINGHYDYSIETVEKVDNAWRLTYAVNLGLNGQRPKFIRFRTTDDWQSFQIEADEHEPNK